MVISTYPDSCSKYEDSGLSDLYLFSIPLIVNAADKVTYLSVDLDLPNAESIEGILSNPFLGEQSRYFESLKINAPKATCCVVFDYTGDNVYISTPFYLFSESKASKIQSVEFNGPSLKNGGALFGGTELEEFSGDLSSLLTGQGMFSGCRLSLNSIQNIANCINDISEKPWDGSKLFDEYFRLVSDAVSEEDQLLISRDAYGELTLGIDASLEGAAELEEALEAIRAKGWTTAE